MLETLAVILMALWLFGYFGGYAMGGLIHLLLVVAIVMMAVRFFSGRRPVL